jgi:hypothetical protein
MYRHVWTLGVIAVLASVACSPKDISGISGTTGFSSISLTTDSTAIHLNVGDVVTVTPVVKIEPQDLVVPNGADNVRFTFSNPDVANLDEDGNVAALAAGTTTLTLTYTDANHDFATTSIDIPITVSPAT